MGRSAFLELLDEEMSLAKGAKGAFNGVEGLKKMLEARATLIKKVEAAREKGQLSQEQHDQLIAIIRKHSLPGS
jgi:hypothetical protein